MNVEPAMQVLDLVAAAARSASPRRCGRPTFASRRSTAIREPLKARPGPPSATPPVASRQGSTAMAQPSKGHIRSRAGKPTVLLGLSNRKTVHHHRLARALARRGWLRVVTKTPQWYADHLPATFHEVTAQPWATTSLFRPAARDGYAAPLSATIAKRRGDQRVVLTHAVGFILPRAVGGLAVS